MVGTTWDQAFPTTTSPVWLWHVLPGFLGDGARVTIFRATEATFLESFRRFGFPSDHPCRLERHVGLGLGGGSAAADWTVSLINTSPLAVPRYRIRSAAGGAALSADAPNDRVFLSPPTAADGGDASSVWFIVPRTGSVGRGWDIVHAASGKRLIATPDGRGVALTAWLHPGDHWDIANPSADRRMHRPHFWLPAFLRDAFRDRLTEEPPYASAAVFGAVAGTHVSQTGVTARWLAPRADVLRRAGGDGSVAFFGCDWEGTATFYSSEGNALDAQRDEVGAVEERERRAYQDATPRGPAGTGEFPLRSYVTYYVRRPPAPPAAAAYADCLTRLGMDATVCESLLVNRVAGGEDARAAVRRDVLGTPPGRVKPGLCTGDRLASALCQRTCADRRSAETKVCEQPLRAYCAKQTVPGLHDPMCACWLPDEVYRAAQEAALQRSGLEVGSPLYTAIAKATQSAARQPLCTYGPCLTAPLRPDFVCPNTSTMVCLQDMSNNAVNTTGNVRLSQSCNFLADGGSEPESGGPDVGFLTDFNVESLPGIAEGLAWWDSLGSDEQEMLALAIAAAVILLLVM